MPHCDMKKASVLQHFKCCKNTRHGLSGGTQPCFARLACSSQAPHTKMLKTRPRRLFLTHFALLGFKSPPTKKVDTERQMTFCVYWSEWRDLNPRPLPPQGSALPPEPHPDYPTANIIAFARGFVKSFLKKIQFIFHGIAFFGLFTIFYRLFSKNA